ncbi:unnamed protein product [Microthlaspi erraticum]|uniref:F-box domain-containing protein n=1 Tax=Microthlaspi erraticum TaxID=1685480 RepID=A0A6D2K173_9BRAS|nr:unnamed protein product [Microthlaspi erraticum]
MGSSSSSQSSLPPAAMKDRGYINWAELPPELTSSILVRLGAIDILENAQRVCTSWRRVCKDPFMWRKIVMHERGYLTDRVKYELAIMCRHAVDRSQGGLLEIEIWHFATDSLLTYIADRSSNLRSLRLTMCNLLSDKGRALSVAKLPLLEELELSHCSLSEESLKAVGQSCPNLKTLKLNMRGNRDSGIVYDDDAFAISETMRGLVHLQLFGNYLTNAGLNAILDNCPNLEHLDLRQCFNLNLVGDLEKRCSERIKVVRRPNDSTHDYPFDATVFECDPSSSDDDDFGFGFIPGFY